MTVDTWQALARRHVFYRQLLLERMAEWPESRFHTCISLKTVQYVLGLENRAERHEKRMERHMERASHPIPVVTHG